MPLVDFQLNLVKIHPGNYTRFGVDEPAAWVVGASQDPFSMRELLQRLTTLRNDSG